MNRDITSKSELRKILLSRRSRLSLKKRESAAKNAAELFANSSLFQKSQEIACYYPHQNEFDCLPIIQKIWAAKKNCYLPVVSSGNTHHLSFIHYEENTPLQRNRYDIPEPVSDHFIAIEKLDLVLLPLVGFDLQGNRLGMGAGYYDRTFQALEKCFLLGLGYEIQKIENLPHDPWDLRLNGVLTDKKVVYFKKSKN